MTIMRGSIILNLMKNYGVWLALFSFLLLLHFLILCCYIIQGRFPAGGFKVFYGLGDIGFLISTFLVLSKSIHPLQSEHPPRDPPHFLVVFNLETSPVGIVILRFYLIIFYFYS